jgi:protease-4
MQAVYDNFTGAVAEYRELPLERVAELARGRIWSGTDALEHDLIDGVGGLDEAIRLAREKAGIGVTDEIPVLVFPRPKPFFQALLEGDFASETPPVSRLGAGLLHRLEVEARPQVRVMMVFPAEVR